MGKNIDPGPKGHRFEPRLHPPLRMISARNRTARRHEKGERGEKNLVTLLDLCVSSLRRGHANLLCIVPILSDDLRGESNKWGFATIKRRIVKPGIRGRVARAARLESTRWGNRTGRAADSGSEGRRFKAGLGEFRVGGHGLEGLSCDRCQRRALRGQKNLVILLDMCVSSLRRGHATEGPHR